MGDSSLRGDNRTSQMASSVYPFDYKNSLLMESWTESTTSNLDLTSLVSIEGISNNLLYFGTVTIISRLSLSPLAKMFLNCHEVESVWDPHHSHTRMSFLSRVSISISYHVDAPGMDTIVRDQSSGGDSC